VSAPLYYSTCIASYFACTSNWQWHSLSIATSWSDLSNLAFDPNYALFKNTDGFLMYPNPTSKLAHGADHVILFEFLGRILGKALYEGITIQPQFAHLFLSFLRGDHNYLHLLTDLSTIDPQLYGNLMFLKNYDGDVSDLCLTFTVSHDDFGVQEVPLIAGGENIDVTNENKRRYIYLVAKHHVSDRIKEQSDAFTRGLWDVIDRSWLRLFNEPELQVLISGASDGKIDISDMKSNTRYTGGYTRLDRNVVRFWSVVSSLSPKHQADLLRFVTSCERPPPLGFSSMNPPFTIQRVGIMRDADKLPTASTCFNTLKLPTYSSEKVLREKLIYSIGAGAGFELT
jgi:ubiquitin-protein ligase E3 C